MRPIADQTILLTGATDGLGKAVATELAAAGASLLLHGRDWRKGADTLREIRDRTGNADVRWYRADLSSLREFWPAIYVANAVDCLAAAGYLMRAIAS